MKPYVVVAAAVAVLTSASIALAQPITAGVTLDGTNIGVQPERIEVRRGRGAVVIRWELPSGADYRFDPQGIVINTGQDQIGGCGGGPRHITCTNRNSRRGEFKYTVRLLDQNQRLIEKDPFIVNID
jgi:hypothetical protein